MKLQNDLPQRHIQPRFLTSNKTEKDGDDAGNRRYRCHFTTLTELDFFHQFLFCFVSLLRRHTWLPPGSLLSHQTKPIDERGWVVRFGWFVGRTSPISLFFVIECWTRSHRHRLNYKLASHFLQFGKFGVGIPKNRERVSTRTGPDYCEVWTAPRARYQPN